MYANICALNAFRRARGLNTFALRPHCGEAGHVSHLLTGYLTSESIAHGILLRKVPVLQYLFYLTQMGIAMSPLSNNSLFISYQRNPLPEYLQKVSPNSPYIFFKNPYFRVWTCLCQLMTHCSSIILRKLWWKSTRLLLKSGSSVPVTCASWPETVSSKVVSRTRWPESQQICLWHCCFQVKIHWLGPNYKEEGVLGNDIHRTNVPDIRVSFRHEALVDELYNLFRVQHTLHQWTYKSYPRFTIFSPASFYMFIHIFFFYSTFFPVVSYE